MFRVAAIAAALIVSGACLSADAPPPPSGTVELLRQQERERELRQRQLEQAPDVRLQPPAAPEAARLPEGESPCFTIREIQLTGDTSDKFQWALRAAAQGDDRAIRRCLGTAGINIVIARVQNAIIRRGFVTTRVLAEPQDIATGTLALTLVPGRIHAIRFAEGTPSRATKWNAVPARPGDLLNLRDIEQALENFKRVPTADADIQITPAEGADAKPGESDVVIRWKQVFPFRVNLSADDSGTRPTGRYRGGVALSFDDPLALNDLFYASYYHDLGSSSGRGNNGYTAHYSVPLGYWLFGITTNRYDYHQTVAGANQTYVYSGESTNHEARVARLIYRDAVRKTTASLRGWLRDSRNFIDDTEIEVQRRRVAGWEAGLGHREFIGAATLDLGVAYRRGTGAFHARPAPEEPFGEGTSRLKLYTAEGQLSAPFALGGQRLRYNGLVRAQWNRTPLVPQDRFAIGGRYTVRGFDGENLLLAERGWLVRNDIGIAFAQNLLEAYLGVDYGQVSGPSTQTLIGRRLAGAVIGVRGGYKGGSFDVFVGQPLKKPEGFKTASTTAGFNINWSF